MSFYQSKSFLEDLSAAAASVVGLESLYGKSVLIAGASGLIGSFITDILMECNRSRNAGITVYALDRNQAQIAQRFDPIKTDRLIYIEGDVNQTPSFDYPVDYMIHAASNAFPAAFNSDPVGTVMSNIQGTKNLLDYGVAHGTKRLLYISSGEVYGQGDLTLEAFEESYSGYVDPTSVRSCYPNGKRAAETLCVAYTKQFGLETVIVRPSHTYGPCATRADNRANVQFVNKGLAGEDIVLNSAGSQLRSYTYITDSASAILSVLASGESANAYNIANSNAKTTIAGYAQTVAKLTGTKVIFADPDAVAKAEQTPIEKQVLSSKKLEGLGWVGRYTVEEGIARTLQIMRELEGQ